MTKSIVPPQALSFNAARDGLVIDDTKREFADEPRHVFTEAAYGQDAHYKRESYTGPHTMENSFKKAYTARTRNQTSLEFKALTDMPANAYLLQIPEVVAVGGGVPIKAGGATIGAVGVSGAPGGDKDEVCALAGIARVADQLK